MLHIRLDLQNLDYENTLVHFYPMVSNALNNQPDDQLAIRLLQQLGDTTRDAALLMMKEISPEETDDLLCTMINLYEKQLRSKLQQMLDQMGWGDCVKLGPIRLETRLERNVRIHVHCVHLNYGKLLRKPEVQYHLPDIVQLIPMAGVLASMLEGVLVRNDKLQSAIQKAAADTIAKSGVKANMKMLIVETENDAQPMISVPSELSPELKEMMMNTVVRFTKRIISAAA